MQPQELLEHASWVRALARRIVHDADAAEDLAQETLVVALRKGPRGGVSLRTWLASVMRNLKRTRRRSELRRERRDRGHVAALEEPSTYELVEQAATERELVGLLLELEEPYRTALLLRYFRDLSQQEIAERTGVPASTVGTRLSRGVARLRERWAARHGAEPDGLQALVPIALLAPRGWWRGIDPVGSLFASHPWIPSSLLFLALVLGGVALVRDEVEGDDGVPAGHEVAGAAVASTSVGIDAGVAASKKAVRAELFAPHSVEDAAFATPMRSTTSRAPRARGRVLDVGGDPVPDLELLATPSWIELDLAQALPRGSARLRTDAEGCFASTLSGSNIFLAAGEGWTTVFAGLTPLNGEGEPLVVVAPSFSIHGGVVDELGEPVAGARLELLLDSSPQRRIGIALDESMPMRFAVESDVSGSFVLYNVPMFEAAGRASCRIVASASGFLESFQEVPAELGELRIVLERGDPREAVQGIVRHADGRAAAGALVSAGLRTVRADDKGRFYLNLHRPEDNGSHGAHAIRFEPSSELVAVVPGFLPGRASLVDERDPEQALEVELGPAAPCLRGRVVDPRGAPIPGVEVAVLEETEFGLLPYARSGDNQARTGMRLCSIESLYPDGTSSARETQGQTSFLSDADGRFAIPGLLERDYRIEVQTADDFFVATSEPVRPGGEEVLIVLSREPRTVAGRIVDHRGEPIPGVRVSLSRRRAYSGPKDLDWSFSIGRSAITGLDGGFELLEVSLGDTFLRLGGDPILPEVRRDLPEGMDPENLHLVAGRRCYVQFQVPEAVVGARLEVRDGDDALLESLFLEGYLMGTRPWIALQESGLSAVYTISDAARTVRLVRGENELARHPIEPIPDRVVRIGL